MKSIDVIHKFGHLYNRQTKERILIEDGVEMSIVINEKDILEKDVSLSKRDEPMDSRAKADELRTKFETYIPYWKILSEGESLFFKISGKVPKQSGSESFELEFRLKLLEDLYIYNRKKDKAKAALFPCKCVIAECFNRGFEFFEPVYGDSLNKARTKLHELFFSRVVNPASNAFREFYITQDYKKGTNLDQLRLEAQEKIPENSPEITLS